MRTRYFRPIFLRLTLLWALVALLSTTAFAQWKVSGVVTSADTGETLIGASVYVKETTNGTITDLDGSYELDVKDPNAILVFSYTGYITREEPVRSRQVINMALRENIAVLDEIVVIGYGTQKKSDMTGAVGTVKEKDIQRIPTSSIDQALQGKVAGVYVTPTSGQPGAGAVIRIRGTGTFNNANPIYVVDGMIVDDASFVNPLDVASIEVLKDASATAIYGNRGANGVILITTKKGEKRENAVISFSSYYGSQSVTRQIDMANASEYAELYNELTNTTYFKDPAALGEGTNWQDVVFRDAPISSIQLSANGGSDKFLFNVSGNYFNQVGILEGSDFKRYTVRFNSEYQLNKSIRTGHNVAFSNNHNTYAPNLVESAYRMPPVFAERDSTGEFSDPTYFGTAIGNPAAQLYYNDNTSSGNRLVGNVYADVSLLKYFTFRSSFGVDMGYNQGQRYEPVYEVSVSQRNPNDRLDKRDDRNQSWLWENTLTFNKEWEKQQLNVLAGYTVQEYQYEYLTAGRQNFPGSADEILFLNLGSDTTQINSNGAGDWAMISYLFRANYSALDRYLVTASLRVDGSSRFSPDNRWGYFPSFSVGWNLGTEPFIANLGLFDRLKLRAGWGIVGNDKTTLYPSYGIVSTALYGIFGPDETLNQGATLTSIGNSDVRWEEASQTNIGVEMGFFNNRFTAEIDYYNRLTNDILFPAPIPGYVGSQNDPIVNTGQVVNRGWDFLVQWRDGGAFTYNIGLNASTVHNEVLAIAEGKSEIFSASLGQGDFGARTVVGLPIGAFYGYKVAGVFQNAEELSTYPKFGSEKVGDLRFQDLNGDGELDDKDRDYLGSPIPDFLFGLTAGFDFKGFDFTFDLNGQRGNKVINAKQIARYAIYNFEARYLDRWTPDNPSDTEPRITNGGHNFRMSDRFIEDGDFIRLRNITLGYTLPISVIQKVKGNRLRIYVSGTNLWTSQKYTGYSPEFSSQGNVFEVGIDRGIYPIAKTVLGGIELTF
ncbi:MAG: TonB-dependent receptor [Saprospirales bacterium]|nr:TonB-dependent receptor [Saprospirales bacterium]